MILSFSVDSDCKVAHWSFTELNALTLNGDFWDCHPARFLKKPQKHRVMPKLSIKISKLVNKIIRSDRASAGQVELQFISIVSKL